MITDPTSRTHHPWLSLTSPNGQWGCLTIIIGQFVLCVGFVPGMFGIDLVIGTKVWSIN